MKYLLSFRTQQTGGPVVPGYLEVGPGLGTLDQLQVESRVTVLLHGFNVDLAKGRTQLLQLADMIAGTQAGGLIAVLWPGDHWVGPLSYSFEGRDADDTAFELAQYLNDHIRAGAEINFIAHSLGCRVTLETIKRMLPAGRNFEQVCLMAAAIDDDCLSAPGVYLQAASRAQRVASLSSKKDRVLRFAYPAGDLLQSFLFWADSEGLALGYHGPRKHRASATPVPANALDERIRKSRKVRHADYLPETPPSQKQQSAVEFADAVIRGDSDPVYS